MESGNDALPDRLAAEYVYLAALRRQPSAGAFALEDPRVAYDVRARYDDKTQALLLYCQLLRQGLSCPLEDLESRCAQRRVVSLLDYNALLRHYMLTYATSDLEALETTLESMKSFWRLMLRSPFVPDHAADLKVCFYCLCNDKKFKELNFLRHNLITTFCPHYHALAERPEAQPEAPHEPQRADGYIDAYVKQDFAIEHWQSTNETTHIARRVEKDELRRDAVRSESNKELAARLREVSDSVLDTVRQKTRELKYKLKLDDIARTVASLEAERANEKAAKYFILEPFAKLHTVALHCHALRATLETFSAHGAGAPVDTERLQSRLRTVDVNHLRSKIVNAFYDLMVPPEFAYSKHHYTVNTRFAVDGLLVGAECDGQDIANLRAYLKAVDIGALCGQPPQVRAYPLQTLFWSVANIFAYCTVLNNGRQSWGRADDARDGGPQGSFIHLYGGRWAVVFACRDERKTRRWTAAPDSLFACLTQHMDLVAAHGGGFR